MSVHHTLLFLKSLVASSLYLCLSPSASHHGADRHGSKTLTLLVAASQTAHRYLLPDPLPSPPFSVEESIVELVYRFPTRGNFLFAQSPFSGLDTLSFV